MLKELMEQDGPYADVEIMRIINRRDKVLAVQKEKENKKSIEEPERALVMEHGATVLIDHENMKLEYKELFDKKYFVVAPVSFKDSHKKISELKKAIAPQTEFLTNKNAEKNFIFQLLDVSGKDILNSLFQDTIQAMEQDENFIQAIREPIEIEGESDKTVLYYECFTKLYTTTMYNIIWMEMIQSKILIALFSCNIKTKKNWRAAAFGIINSFAENKISNKNIAIRA